ncbi:YihY/virulence factor BrkB family protein [Aquabacter spiritensis]|uniref:Membrane protein n=1 Tax=Aquabacter spiritensis TaxID=933073 RepID=A0A4R3LSR0_9HYPH|nr:YihY/virulence factor BrkB family protein [Aquabacter spiritensis]TCT03550.1 membrane protein [Aquabacter spiritensis]
MAGWGSAARVVWSGMFLGGIVAVLVARGAQDPLETPGLRGAPRAAREPGRGRTATSPLGIPRRGWRDILVRTFKEFFSDRVLGLSAGVTFYTLLAVFPALGAFISLYGLFFDPSHVQQQLDAASWVLPGGAIEVLREQTTRIVATGGSTLGFGFAVGLGTALWSANAGTKAMIEALNIAYEEEERRSFLMRTAVSLIFTVAGILFAILALASVVALPVATRLISLETGTEWLVSNVRWPLLALAIGFAITVIYRYGPCRVRARWRWVSLGSVVAALLWLAVSAAFSWYVANFGSYNETYGSLGAVMGFMTWIWLSVTVILFGAELNAEIEHQTALDTTTGPPRPMGRRGATMADTLGPAQ